MKINGTDFLIKQINEFLPNLSRQFSEQYVMLEKGANEKKIHPFVKLAFKAHKQIDDLKISGKADIPEEVWEVSGLAIYSNALKRAAIKGFEDKLNELVSNDFGKYGSIRYEIQVGGMLFGKGHKVEFIKEKRHNKTPDLLIANGDDKCEIECKHKTTTTENELDYISSIYNNTQCAKEQFSKVYAGAIFIEIDKRKYSDFMREGKRLADKMDEVMQECDNISAICITSRIAFEDEEDFVYRHRAGIRLNPKAKIPMSRKFLNGLINI
jgi:hypothetical protein